LSEVSKKIDVLGERLGTDANIVEDCTIQKVDPNIKCGTTLEVFKSIPKFTGEPTQYVAWREAAETAMSLYIIQSQH